MGRGLLLLLLLDSHAVLLHSIKLVLERRNHRPLRPNAFLRGSIGGTGGFIFVNGGHPISMKTRWDGGLIQNVLNDKKVSTILGRMASRARDPLFVFFGVHPASLDDVEADVDDVGIVHRVASAAGVASTGEQAVDDGVEPVAGMPIGSHSVAIPFAIFGGCLAVVFDEPEEEIDEDNVGFAQTTLEDTRAY